MQNLTDSLPVMTDDTAVCVQVRCVTDYRVGLLYLSCFRVDFHWSSDAPGWLTNEHSNKLP